MRHVIHIESKDDHHVLFQRLECVEVKVSCIFSIRLCMRIIFLCFLIDLLMLKNLLRIHVTTRKVRKVLLQLNTSKSSRTDGIPAIVLKSCAPELAHVLKKLFQFSYNLGIFPSSWKLAHVFAIHQKGDKYDPSTYRPFAITFSSLRLWRPSPNNCLSSLKKTTFFLTINICFDKPDLSVTF